ncbi:MAG: hypothetical protein SAL07_15660 [Oscillatoria sp. PMC 1051.18]|nr:hypothetical protein [Oscillatoria sp. PMC 1050.18]MEC5031335.1 hypothetical protein [Oscillatoria sp. PMC 1051.18]
MNPNFEKMSIPELRAYVLENREDKEAIRALFYHPKLKWKTSPPIFTKDGKPIEENIRIAEENICKLAEAEKRKERNQIDE